MGCNNTIYSNSCEMQAAGVPWGYLLVKHDDEYISIVGS
jgi:hypothetical protein